MFCSFLALLLRKELPDRLTAPGDKFEWAAIVRDLEALERVEVEHQGQRFWLHSAARGRCAAVLRAAGVAFPATVRAVPE